MPSESEVISALENWHDDLKRYADKLPAKGTISAALIVLERLRADYDLSVSAHIAGGQSQIAGLSGTKVNQILRQFGETRSLSAIGGRSNRGARGDMERFLGAMRELNLELLAEGERARLLEAMQRHIVQNYVALYFSVKRVKAVYEPAQSTSRFIENILGNARTAGKAGAVAEHLVGAKLALRFPKNAVRNKPFSAADSHSGYEGDFEIGNTIFHVTVAPMPELFTKLKGNLERGLRVYLLVPFHQLVGAKQNCEMVGAGRIEVAAIETFVATNLDELNEFDGDKLKSGLLRLLDKFNERVAAVEHDKSLLIEVPRNLK